MFVFFCCTWGTYIYLDLLRDSFVLCLNLSSISWKIRGKKIFSPWSSDYFSLCAMTSVHASHWVEMCPEITSRVGLKGSLTFPPFARTCCNVKGHRWQMKRRIIWLRILRGSGCWCVVFKLWIIYMQYRRAFTNTGRRLTEHVFPSVFASQSSLFIHLLWLLLLEKSFAEEFSTTNCIILHPALGQNLELGGSSKLPHFSAFKINVKPFAPGLEESPSQI